VTVLWIRPPDCLALPRRNSFVTYESSSATWRFMTRYAHQHGIQLSLKTIYTFVRGSWSQACPSFLQLFMSMLVGNASQFDASRMRHGVRSTDIRSAYVVLRQQPTIPCLFSERSHGGWANSGAESGNYRQSLISTLSIFWQSRAASHTPRTDSVGGSYHPFQLQRSERPSEKCTPCQSVVSAALQTACACLYD
jgi:hypothetical protein